MIRSSSSPRPTKSYCVTRPRMRRNFSLELRLFICPAAGSCLVEIKLDAVLAHALRLVKRTIGGGDNGFRRVNDRRESRHADADCDAAQRLRFAVRVMRSVDTLPDAIRDRAGFDHSGLR